ncbi:MAG: endonuclease/exonuclease/phosphatase family protein [Pseudomonadota bacterium]
MAKAFSVASWNVEHFGAKDKNHDQPKKPIQPIIDYLASQKADIVVVYEVVGRNVYRPMLDAMPGYQFHITEGKQTQEILVGIKKGMSAFVTQKIEFRSGQDTLRPGVLVTIKVDDQYYPILCLHLKSLPDPKGFGLRDDMMRKALKLKSTLDKSSENGQSNFIFLGDLNTMGFDYPYSAHDITADAEIKELDRRAKYKKMRRLKKSADLSWWNGSDHYKPGSNLDHVVAADHLKFKNFAGSEVSARGWVEKASGAEQKEWIDNFSDHALLYFEVQKA